jgi:hypothetical protein
MFSLAVAALAPLKILGFSSLSMPLFIPKRTDCLGFYSSFNTSGTEVVFWFGTSGTEAVLRLLKSRNRLLPQNAIWVTLTYVTNLSLAIEFSRETIRRAVFITGIFTNLKRS